MRCEKVRAVLALGLAWAITAAPGLPLQAGTPSLGKVIPRSGTSLLNGTELTLETTLYPGDRVATRGDSLALILLAQGDQVQLGPESSARVSGEGQEVVLSLEQGMTVARSGQGQQVSVNARGLLVRPAGPAVYEVALQGEAVVVSSRQGSVEVQGTNRSFVVPAGKTMKFELAVPAAEGPTGVGAHNLAPAAAAVIAVAVAVGATLAVAIPVYQNKIDNAEDACRELAESASPALPVPSECD